MSQPQTTEGRAQAIEGQAYLAETLPRAMAPLTQEEQQEGTGEGRHQEQLAAIRPAPDVRALHR